MDSSLIECDAWDKGSVVDTHSLTRYIEED